MRRHIRSTFRGILKTLQYGEKAWGRELEICGRGCMSQGLLHRGCVLAGYSDGNGEWKEVGCLVFLAWCWAVLTDLDRVLVSSPAL